MMMYLYLQKLVVFWDMFPRNFHRQRSYETIYVSYARINGTIIWKPVRTECVRRYSIIETVLIQLELDCEAEHNWLHLLLDCYSIVSETIDAAILRNSAFLLIRTGRLLYQFASQHYSFKCSWNNAWTLSRTTHVNAPVTRYYWQRMDCIHQVYSFCANEEHSNGSGSFPRQIITKKG